MATVQKIMFRGAASTSDTALYVVPSATEAVVTNIIVANDSVDAEAFSLSLAGISMATTVDIEPNSVITFDVKQVLEAEDAINGSASSTSIKFHISGVEIA